MTNSTLFAKTEYIRVQQERVNLRKYTQKKNNNQKNN